MISLEKLLFGVAFFGAVTAGLAHFKGYRFVDWFPGMGLLGVLVLLWLPAPGDVPERHRSLQAASGNKIGRWLSTLTVALVGVVCVNDKIQERARRAAAIAAAQEAPTQRIDPPTRPGARP